jgi:microcystin-dependent protein
MGADPYIGEISIFAGNFNPLGWAFCQGQLLQISQYSALYALLGNMYGGDGRTNFALPDLRGRSVVGYGSGAPGRTARNFADYGGVETVILSTSQIPAHNHTAISTVSGSITGKLKCVSANGTASNPQGGLIAAHANAFLRSGTTSDMNANALAVDSSTLGIATTIQNAGNNGQHENMHPWLTLGYIIALEGIFPPRE